MMCMYIEYQEQFWDVQSPTYKIPPAAVAGTRKSVKLSTAFGEYISQHSVLWRADFRGFPVMLPFPNVSCRTLVVRGSSDTKGAIWINFWMPFDCWKPSGTSTHGVKLRWQALAQQGFFLSHLTQFSSTSSATCSSEKSPKHRRNLNCARNSQHFRLWSSRSAWTAGPLGVVTMEVILGHQDTNIWVATSNMAAGHCQVDRLGRRIHIGPHFLGLQSHCNQRETQQWAACLSSLQRRRCFIVKTRDHLVLQFLSGYI